MIDVLAEDPLMSIEPPAHVDVLRSLAGEGKGHRPRLSFAAAHQQAVDCPGFERLDCLLCVTAYQHLAMGEDTASHLKSPVDIGDGILRTGFQMTQQISGYLFHRLPVARPPPQP